MPLISVVIPTYKAHDCLILCAKSLAKCKNKELIEICIYGDGGGDAARDALETCRQIFADVGLGCHLFYNPQNLGNTPAVNRAVEMATGEWIFLCNDDMVFPENWLSVCVVLLQKNRVLSVSCVEPNLGGHKPSSYFYSFNMGVDPLNFDSKPLNSFNESICEKHTELETGVNYPFFVERELFYAVGAADEMFSGPYHDPDLFLRFRIHGAEMVRTQACALYHFSGMSLRFLNDNSASKKRTKSRKWVQNENEARLKFIRKWGAKPRSRFGEIPKTRAQTPMNWQTANAWLKVSVTLLIAWETLRGRLRELRYT